VMSSSVKRTILYSKQLKYIYRNSPTKHSIKILNDFNREVHKWVQATNKIQPNLATDCKPFNLMAGYSSLVVKRMDRELKLSRTTNETNLGYVVHKGSASNDGTLNLRLMFPTIPYLLGSSLSSLFHLMMTNNKEESFYNIPVVAVENDVIALAKTIVNVVVGYADGGESSTIMETPVAIVVVGIKADVGVGPSIASGN
ncbi:hypothetical protein KI387_001523, partial [Taxus chinensis]